MRMRVGNDRASERGTGVPLGKQMELVGVFCVEDLAGVASC